MTPKRGCSVVAQRVLAAGGRRQAAKVTARKNGGFTIGGFNTRLLDCMSQCVPDGINAAEGSIPISSNCNIDFGFDAEIAAGDLAQVSGSSPPIAVPTNRASHARANLHVQVAFEPPEFRTVSPVVDPSNMETATDSPIGGGLMYGHSVASMLLLRRAFHHIFRAQKIQRRRELIQVEHCAATSPSVRRISNPPMPPARF